MKPKTNVGIPGKRSAPHLEAQNVPLKICISYYWIVLYIAIAAGQSRLHRYHPVMSNTIKRL